MSHQSKQSKMLRDEDVLNEGFRPLKKTLTEPMLLPSRPDLTRGMSFATEAGSHTLWEGTQWSKLEKSRGKLMERTNSFVGTSTRKLTLVEDDLTNRAVVIVDPFSTGAHLAAGVVQAGFKCVRVFSIWDSPVAALIQEGVVVDFGATIQHNDTLADQDDATNQTVEALRGLPFTIVAVLPGAETGVELADRLSHRMNLRSNGEEGSLARRNKFLMGEKVRDAGVRAVKQRACTSVEMVNEFLDTLTARPLKCVVKPVQSAGTDDVFLCNNREDAMIAFNRIFGKKNGLGLINESALVQEFLAGKEFVVDQVSKDGQHKLVAIWEYDKRSINGANFVYFGNRLRSSDTAKAQELKQYADKVLDALGIVNGPSHMEVMYCSDGPCLVEVGSRCQGGEGTWLPVVMECIGYSQVSVTLDMYLNGKLFDSIDSHHYPLMKYGRDVDIVSRYGGMVRSLPGDALIRALPSFRVMSWEVKPGDYQALTIDCFTRPGCVQLVHESEEQADRDLEAIHEMELTRMIDYSVICPVPPMTGAVVVVDPFSTGANLAATVIKMGYKLIIVFAEINSPVSSFVASGVASSYKTSTLIQHNSKDRDTNGAIQATLAAIRGLNVPVLAILPGAETGVALAEQLATRYGTRNNGETLTDARRTKNVMQDTIQAAGLRSIKQSMCYSMDDVTAFVSQLGSEVCVVKPNASTGSDGVTLCRSLGEATDAFIEIDGGVNGLGHTNHGALCQEFLLGQEYVVDAVSRDGIFKVVALWAYDKRAVNGANFVYFGMRLVSCEDARAQAIISYASKVAAALGIVNGPSHMEVMHCSDGPCLVEVGSRCHGGEGTWLPVVMECIGYSQLDATMNCYLRPDRFDELPMWPVLRKCGCEVFLVSYQSGVVRDIPGVEEIRALESCVRVEMMTQPGCRIGRTNNCFSRPGSVQLVHANSQQLELDYDRIRVLENECKLFETM